MADEKDFDIFETLNPPSQEDRDLAAMLFAETAPPPATQTVTVEEAPAPPEAREEAPKKPGLLARLKGLFKRKAPAPKAEEAPAKTPPEEAGTATKTEEEAPPPRRFNTKLLLIGLAVLTLLGAGIGGTALVFQRVDAAREAEQQKKEAQLAAEKTQLAAEKTQLAAEKALLEKQKAELAAKAQEQQAREKPAQESAPAAAEPAPQKEMKAAPEKPSSEAGDVDCAVVGKEGAAQTIKRCIETYNRATGRTK